MVLLTSLLFRVTVVVITLGSGQGQGQVRGADVRDGDFWGQVFGWGKGGQISGGSNVPDSDLQRAVQT